MEDTRKEIVTLLRQKKYRELKTVLEDLFPVDIAEILEELTGEECIILFRLLYKEQAAEVFSYLGVQERKQIVSAISKDLLSYILSELYFDDKIDFLEEMPANFVRGVLAAASPEERGQLNQFLNFPENSAGSLMTIEYVDLKQQMTAREAMARIKRVGLDKETIYTCYVVDNTQRLEGILSLRQLVLADEEQRIGDLMHTEIVSVEAHDDQEAVAELFKKYDLIAIPVVDAEQRMIGIITIDDIVDIIEKENTEDFQKMAAMTPSEQPYLDTGVLRLARGRIVWLLVLMISATFTGAIITKYEALLSSAVALAAFIPMLMDSGGNAGSQSSTLIIRGMALGEIGLRDWARVLWKELRVGLIAGILLALVNFARMALLGHNELAVCMSVAVTLLLTVVVAKLVGGLLPIGAKALRLDPAIMAGPLITTIVDAFSLVIYFGIASVLVLNK